MAKARDHRWLLIAAALGTAAGAVLVLARAPLGVADEWPVRFIGENAVGVLVEPAVLAVALLGVVWFGLTHAEHAARRRIALALMVVVGFLFALYLGMAGPLGMGEPAYRTLFSSGIGSYLDEARHIGPFPDGRAPEGGVAAPGPVEYVSNFHKRVARHPLDATSFRVAVHPPGMTLVVYGVDRFWRSSADRRERGARLFRSLGWPGVNDLVPADRPTSAEKLVALVMPVRGAAAVALAALLVYLLTFDLLRIRKREHPLPSGGGRSGRGGNRRRTSPPPSPSPIKGEGNSDRRAAVGAAALWLTVPSVLLHAPALDQFTPVMALVIAWCWVRACTRRSLVWAILAGAAAWIGLFFTLGMGVVLFALAVGSALWWKKGSGTFFL